ncbi:hypothetical protein EJ03DRAFT_326861 [Teratosphaeria nubilosa]|uniref:DUF7730 domain-containing protein n=1 Tax=Teratosphaeria nubilosa TaxID=161662 RepID=A0A6G1LC11_9PEZI|nr:hypothetical protein EJ03DRAFT_326861 [Teratosphaeria nubilosa]
MPKELRVMIYEFALTFPKSGIGLQTSGRVPALLKTSLIKRIDGCDPLRVDWYQAKSAYDDGWAEPVIGLPHNALAILLTCREIFEESMPVFYKNNLFHFYRSSTIGRALTRLNPGRLQHLTRITLALDFVTQKADLALWAKAMRATAAIKHIKELRISARDPHPEWGA